MAGATARGKSQHQNSSQLRLSGSGNAFSTLAVTRPKSTKSGATDRTGKKRPEKNKTVHPTQPANLLNPVAATGLGATSPPDQAYAKQEQVIKGMQTSLISTSTSRTSREER